MKLDLTIAEVNERHGPGCYSILEAGGFALT